MPFVPRGIDGKRVVCARRSHSIGVSAMRHAHKKLTCARKMLPSLVSFIAILIFELHPAFWLIPLVVYPFSKIWLAKPLELEYEDRPCNRPIRLLVGRWNWKRFADRPSRRLSNGRCGPITLLAMGRGLLR